MEAHTPSLHEACRTGEIEDVRRLLDESPSLLNRPDLTNGCSPLHHAAFGGQADVVEELLGRGAIVDARDRSGSTPLHYAAFAGASMIARTLMDAEADPAARNDSLTTVLHTAARGGMLDLVEELLDRGFDSDTRNLYGETPLHHAAQSNRLGVVRLLVERGATIDPADRYLLTPIHKAAIGGAVEVLEWLADRGGSLDAGDLLGDTALHCASSMGRTETVGWLLEHGAAVDSGNAEGATPLHAAARSGAVDTIEVLLSHHADPNASDTLGRTPLHVAAASGKTEALSPLINAGSRLDTTDAERNAPSDLAATHGRDSAHRTLTERGAPGRIEPSAMRSLVARPPTPGELVVWYLGNSGWAIRTASQFLIVDYAPGADEEGGSLLNGRIVPDELPDLPVTVLVSHHHADHFSPRILEWANDLDARFVFGWDARLETPGHRFAGPGEATVGDVRVSAIPSTDSGSAFLIEAGGFRVYHAGDHAANETPPEEAFTKGIEDLAARFAPVDVCFLPVFGCGLPSVESLRAGNDLTIRRLAPRVVFPMHVGWTGHFYREEKHRLEAQGFRGDVVAASEPGDRWLYRDGRVRAVPLGG
jgi:ankyrin repeat protein/L-ascorbate metabolism protein UlaG (beta-lactamase superfamily)